MGEPAEQTGVQGVPPHDMVAEQALLGAMLLSAEAAQIARTRVGAADFYRLAHQDIFQAVCDVADETGTVDLVLVRNALLHASKLEQVGGAETLTSCMEACPSSGNVEYYAALVVAASVKRFIYQETGVLAHAAGQPSTAITELQGRLTKCVERFERTEDQGRLRLMSEVLPEVLAELEACALGAETLTVSWGIAGVDKAFQGLVPGRLTVLGATAKTGKTSLSLWLALHNVVSMHRPVLIFSAEMSAKDLCKNALTQLAGLDYRAIKRGTVEATKFVEFTDATKAIRGARLYIDDTPNIDVDLLLGRAMRYVPKHGIALVIVDYLQLLTTRKRYTNYTLEVGDYAKALKGLARRAHVPVLALSQITVGEDGRVKTRWSTEVEQHTDALLLLRRSPQFEGNRKPEPDLARRSLLIAANRFGGQRGVGLEFDKQTLRFRDKEEGDDEGAGSETRGKRGDGRRGQGAARGGQADHADPLAPEPAVGGVPGDDDAGAGGGGGADVDDRDIPF